MLTVTSASEMVPLATLTPERLWPGYTAVTTAVGTVISKLKRFPAEKSDSVPSSTLLLYVLSRDLARTRYWAPLAKAAVG